MNNVNNQVRLSLNQFPAEIIDHVASFGNRFSIDAMQLTCKAWNQIITNSTKIDNKKLRAQYQDYISDYNLSNRVSSNFISFSSKVHRIHSCGQLLLGLTSSSLTALDIYSKQEVLKINLGNEEELVKTKVCKDQFVMLHTTRQMRVYDIRKTKSLTPNQQPIFQTDRFVGNMFHVLHETFMYSPEKGKLAFRELTAKNLPYEDILEISEFDTSIDSFQSNSNGPVVALWQDQLLKIFNSEGEIPRLDKVKALEIHLSTVANVSFINKDYFCVSYILGTQKSCKIYQFKKEEIEGREVITGYSLCVDIERQKHDLITIGENVLAHYQQRQEENEVSYKLNAYIFNQNSFQQIELNGLKEKITILKANSFGLIAYHKNGNHIYLWRNEDKPSLDLTVLSLEVIQNALITTVDVRKVEKKFKNFVDHYAFVQLFDGEEDDSHFLVFDLKKLTYVNEFYSSYSYQLIEDKFLTLTTNRKKAAYKSIYQWPLELLKKLNAKNDQSRKNIQLKIFPLSEEVIQLNKTIQELTTQSLAEVLQPALNMSNRKNKKSRLSLSIKPQKFKTATADLFLKKK